MDSSLVDAKHIRWDSATAATIGNKNKEWCDMQGAWMSDACHAD